MARRKEFEPTEALEKAMHAFWSKGYFDTSMRDLYAQTGVNPYGLYSVFGDKHGIFLAALDRYHDTISSQIIARLLESDKGIQSIRAAFDKAFQITARSQQHVGCLMCTTAAEVAPHDQVVADKISRHMAKLTAAFQSAIDRSKQLGEVDKHRDSGRLAEFLTATLYSVGLLVRSGQSSAMVRRYVDTALEALS